MLVVLAAEALFWRGRVHVDGEKPVGLRMCSQSQEWSHAHLPLCGPEILELQEDALVGQFRPLLPVNRKRQELSVTVVEGVVQVFGIVEVVLAEWNNMVEIVPRR